MHPSDELLMSDFCAGSRRAFEELFARYQSPLYGFFRRRLSSAGRAEDLVQETFLAVLRGAGRYQPRATVKTYLFGIALHLVSAERRRAHKLFIDVLDLSIPAAQSSPERVRSLQQALDRLDPKEREILMLREYEQLTYLEISELLKIPLNTVRSKLFRSRMQMRGLLSLAPQKEEN